MAQNHAAETHRGNPRGGFFEVLRRKLFGNSASWMKFEAWSTPGSENANKLPMENRFGIFMDSPFSDKPTYFQTSPKLIESDRLPQ